MRWLVLCAVSAKPGETEEVQEAATPDHKGAEALARIRRFLRPLCNHLPAVRTSETIEALGLREHPEGGYTLVGCTVSPAFQFEGFELVPEEFE
jgi:hypothetical protein